MDKIQGKRMSSKIRLIIVSLASVIAFIAVAVIVTQIIGYSKPENNSIIVYKKGDETVVRIGEVEKNIGISDASQFVCDEESKRVFYIVESSYSDELFDLYFIEKNRSEITDPKIIDIGIKQNFNVLSGKVYYLKRNISAGAFEGCVCNVNDNRIETFAVNVENVYPLDSDTFYYTKIHGADRVLYVNDNSESSEVCRALINVVCYNNTEQPHVIYEKKNTLNGGMTELFKGDAQGNSELICDNTYFVMYDNYEPGGNLYYFTSSEKSVSWSYVIADQYSETDSAIVKPKKNDFLAILGISSEYNEAYKKYQDKLVRDEIRAALNESVSKGEFSVPVFNAFAYNENGSFMIAENIDPKKVCTASAFGVPKIIYESTDVIPSDTDINSLVEIAQHSEMKDIIDYAKSIVKDNIKSEGIAYAACCDDGAVNCVLDGYDKNKTLFLFSKNGESIFAFVRESESEKLNLYSNKIGANFVPSDEIVIDTGISSYYFTDDSVVYLKSDNNKNSGDIFYYNGEKNEKLSNSASAFIVKNKDIVILKNYVSNGSSETADYYLSVEGKETVIDKDIAVDSFICSDSGKICYLTADNMLCFFSDNGSVAVDNGVTEILLLA